MITGLDVFSWELYLVLFNSRGEANFRSYMTCISIKSNPVARVSLVRSIIMNVSLFVSVSYSNLFEKYILKYCKSYAPYVYVSDKVV